MNKINKKGISLSALIITIIVTLILSSIVMLNLIQNDTVQIANKAKFQNDMKVFREELEIYINKVALTNSNSFSYIYCARNIYK